MADLFSAAVLDRAANLRALVGGVVQDTDHPELWSVAALSEGAPEHRYTVHVGQEGRRVTYVSCDCKHGRMTTYGKARCSHVAAVLMTLKEER